jgi:hypothetical protein
VWLLGARIAAPLGEWPEASQAARKNRNLVCATLLKPSKRSKLTRSLTGSPHGDGVHAIMIR